MVLLSPVIPPVAYWEFEADLLILHHPTTISAKYQAMGKYLFFEVRISLLNMLSCSTLWKYPSNCDDYINVCRTFTNR